MDGFFTARPAHPTGARERLQSKPGTATAGAPATRRVGDFRRPDGFYAPPRRNLQPSGGPRKSPLRNGLANPINMELPEDDKKHKKHGVKLSKKQVFRKWFIRTTVATLIVVLIGGGLFLGKSYFTFRKVFQGGSTAAALTTNVDPTLLKGEGDGRVNVLMLGIGGANHDGSDLTDTMMIASIDPVNNQASLLSIPRDLWTKMPNNFIASYQKINAAYESGKYKYLGKEDASDKDHKAILAGFQATDSVVEQVTGVPIHYNMLVNFQAFQQAVDTVGGVTINAPEELWDPTMAWQNNHSPILAKAGINVFNGPQALNYVRSRETSSDFARGERQRAVLVALKEKTANLGTLTNPLKLTGLMNAFGDNVQSDISISDLTRMASIMKKIPSNQIQSVGLTDGANNFVTTGNINGMSVVMPKAGLEDYSQIQAFIRSKLKDGYITKENANIAIFNGSGISGLATTKSTELKSYGYNVGTVTNAPTEDYTQTQIIDLSNGAKKYTLNYLKNRFSVTTVSKQLPAGVVATGANIVIILGSDAAQN